MTEEHGGMSQEPERPTPPQMPGEPAPGAATPPAAASTSSTMFSTGEGMINLGCYIIIAVYVVTGLLMNEYWPSWFVVIPAIAIVILSRFGRDTAEKVAPHGVIIKILAYLIALVGVLDLVEDIRFASSAFDEFWDVVGSLAFWAAAVLCFLGARQIES